MASAEKELTLDLGDSQISGQIAEMTHTTQTRHKKGGSLPGGHARRRPTECAVGTRWGSSTAPPTARSDLHGEIRVRRLTDYGRATPSLRQSTLRLILIVAQELRE